MQWNISHDDKHVDCWQIPWYWVVSIQLMKKNQTIRTSFWVLHLSCNALCDWNLGLLYFICFLSLFLAALTIFPVNFRSMKHKFLDDDLETLKDTATHSCNAVGYIATLYWTISHGQLTLFLKRQTYNENTFPNMIILMIHFKTLDTVNILNRKAYSIPRLPILSGWANK